MTVTLIVLNVSVLVLLAGIMWAMLRLYRPWLSAIEQELRAVAALLGRLPKESGLREQLAAHEQLLRSIGERLHSHADAELLHRYLQDQTNQLLAIVSTVDSPGKPGVTRADIEDSLRLTNQKLERVLWTLRFDEEKFQASAAEIPERTDNRDREVITQDPAGTARARDDGDASMLVKSLEDGEDSYQAMLDYMRTTGKSGTDALHALEMARVLHGR
jgi:hypothetical protein